MEKAGTRSRLSSAGSFQPAHAPLVLPWFVDGEGGAQVHVHRGRHGQAGARQGGQGVQVGLAFKSIRHLDVERLAFFGTGARQGGFLHWRGKGGSRSSCGLSNVPKASAGHQAVVQPTHSCGGVPVPPPLCHMHALHALARCMHSACAGHLAWPTCPAMSPSPLQGRHHQDPHLYRRAVPQQPASLLVTRFPPMLSVMAGTGPPRS